MIINSQSLTFRPGVQRSASRSLTYNNVNVRRTRHALFQATELIREIEVEVVVDRPVYVDVPVPTLDLRKAGSLSRAVALATAEAMQYYRRG